MERAGPEPSRRVGTARGGPRRTHAAGKAKRDRLTGEITETALEFGLMSAFTSFITVDALEKTEGVFGGTSETPVSVPEGVSYTKTVSGG